MALNMERSERLGVCLNCIQILSVELATGLEEKCDGKKGSLVVSAGSEASLQNFASALHQFVSGAGYVCCPVIDHEVWKCKPTLLSWSFK